MEVKADDEVGIDPLLRPMRCGQCGYRLKGLAEAGRCPECGLEYSPRRVVLFGWACGRKADVANMRARDIWWKSIGFAAFAVWIAFTNWQHGTSHFLLLWLLLWALWLVWGLYHRKRNTTDAPRPTQVRLFAEGFAQRDGVGEVTLKRWAPRYSDTYQQIGANRFRFRICWKWMGFEITSPVDIEFDCDPDTAIRIREHIEWCRQQGAHTAGTGCPH
ncbi:MAG: hypothetical protein NTU53_09455 [Planctomycetota bacterium]|nr:hypothetical protein [Planctomycetota bacterium]